ncbi:MAG: 6-phosphogluconolactonase [Deltaproteobacteria bacterium]|nr:6-phosphogluconolactonase [Deltaproteobacteria bacterium]
MRLFSPVIKPEVIVCRDAIDLGRKAAAQFVSLAAAAIAARRQFNVALSGGSTPKVLYSLLATDEFSKRLAWRQIHLFFGDERCVAPDHAESNFRMVQESLLSKIDIPSGNVHRMSGEKAPPVAAVEYEAELRRHFHLADDAAPRFDLILLGLGEDGHTASLFPGSSALNETRRLVATTYVEKLKAYRLTLTFPVINNAAQINFLIAGASKAAVVKTILSAENNDYPAARVKPENGKLTWFVTQDAAVDLSVS